MRDKINTDIQKSYNKKPNVLFVNLPSVPFKSILESFDGTARVVQPLSMPMGILYLSSYIKKYNRVGRIAILDYVLHLAEIPNYRDVNDYISKIAKKNIDFVPDVLAFSLIFSTSWPFFDASVSVLKNIWPKATVIVGGVHATNCAKQLLQNKNVDFVIRGEGEMTFSEFIGQYSYAKPICVDGIYSKEDFCSATLPKLSKHVENLDSIPFPDWGIIDMESYVNARGRKKNIGSSMDRRIATIMTSRGCPFRCTFCSSHTVHGRKMRFRSVDNVIEEIKLLYKLYGVNLFIPEDDLFTANRNRVINLLAILWELQIPDVELQFPNALSVNTLDTRVLDALISTGMRIASLAIESGSEYVQKYIIKKNCKLNKAKELVAYLKNKGIIVRCYYILGFPHETKEQMLETIKYAKELEADWSLFNIAVPLIGSEMYDQFVQMGCIRDNIDISSEAFYQERAFDTPEVTAVELKKIAYRANLEVNFINNVNLINGNFNRALELFNDIVTTYPFHIIGWYCMVKCYEGLGNKEQVLQIKKKIRVLIESDKRALEMFDNYKDLMQGFNVERTYTVNKHH